MKKTIITLVFLVVAFMAKAQDASVEKSVFGIQTGFFGIWAHNEARLTNELALRTELGLDAGLFISDARDLVGITFVPTITVEPRWYFNLNRRVSKGKRIDGNSGTFLSLKTTYHPDWFLIANEQKNSFRFISDLTVIPTIGIRRNIGKHFNYETGFGIGYARYFESDDIKIDNPNGVAVNLHLRIGYRF